jgi:hypothetical protein
MITKAATLGGGRRLTGKENKILALVPWPREQRAVGLQDLPKESRGRWGCRTFPRRAEGGGVAGPSQGEWRGSRA